MKKVLASLSVVTALFLTGCASNGMAVNTMSNNRVDREFINGSVVSQKKVIIDNREVAILTGVGVGAVGGAIANGGKGAVIGGVIGGVAGGLIGKEVEAFQTTIRADDGMTYQGYLEQRLGEGTRVEFTVVDGKLKNVGVVPQTQQVRRYN